MSQSRDNPNEPTGRDEPVDLTRGVYRRVYAGFIKGRRINAVSLGAEAWFWRVNAAADDFGNADADPWLCHAATAGRRAREVTPEQIAAWVKELAAAGLVEFYESGGDKYLHIVGFTEMQPSARNGRRMRRFPMNPSESGSNVVESGGIRGNPGESGRSDTDTDTDTQNQEGGVSTPRRAASLKSAAGNASRDEHPGPNGKPAGVRQHSPQGASGSPQGDAVPPGFAAFWLEWPPHPRKKGRSKCLRVWQRMNLEPRADEVLASLRRWKASPDWAREGGRYIPGPEPWLNDESWEVPAQALAGVQAGYDPWNPPPEGMDYDRAVALEREAARLNGEL